MLEGDHAGPKRLPFSFEAKGGIGRLALEGVTVGPLVVDRLELEVTDLGTDPGKAVAEKFQRRRTRLRTLAVHVSSHALDERVEQVRRQLAGLGITQLSAKLDDGFVSVRARAADGLAAADVSFRITVVNAGMHLRALASTIRVHGHLPTPGPVIVDRVLVALLGATDAAGVVERPHVRGLCDVEIDLVGALLWHVLPPAGWRLPSVGDLELVRIHIARSALEVVYGPAGTRIGELGVRPQTHQLAAAHDLMHSADAQLREGHLEDAMRGYRALLAAGGPEQPLLLERLLALAAARPAWFFDGLELSRQALGRWPNFPPSHAALASITLAQGDARIAAEHLAQLAALASAEGDDDQAALAALAGARLLRVLDPRAATQLYQLALEHDPSSTEAADALADRFADEQRWPELVRLVRARAVITPDVPRAVQLRLRLADVFVHHLDDPHSAQQELAVARHLAPDDPAVHEMTATILSTIDPLAAISAWQDVARLAEVRGDHRTTARALAIVGDKLVATGAGAHEAEAAWTRALELDPLQSDAIAGLAYAAAAREDHAVAADYLERLRGLGLPPQVAARHELALARSLVAIGRIDDARASLRRATMAGGETAAEAHAVLAEVAEAADDRDHAATELDTAIGQLLELAGHDPAGERMYTRAAELAMARASLFDRSGQASAASGEWTRAHELAIHHAPQIARSAARTMLARSGNDGTERQWIDAVLATRPPPHERAQLLVRRAAARREERAPDMAAALADLHEALRICEAMASNQDGTDPEATEIRKKAYQLEAELLAKSGDQRARAQALAALAKMAARDERVEVETAAAAAWLAADEPAAALPHGARAHAALEPEVPSRVRRDVLLTLGEAAWRQRAWPDVIRAYRGLLDGPDELVLEDASRIGTFRYRLAVAADRTGDARLAIDTLRPLVDDTPADSGAASSSVRLAHGMTPELRGQALRLFADLAERSGDLAAAATALEGFASLAVDSSPTARADAMYRAGELFRRAERADDAIRCLESALRISETHLPALDALEMAWRERGDNERVSVILGRKVAATTRHPARQKPLLSRLGDLQDQLGRPDVALATHQRALEIDPTWRPSLRYVTLRLRDAGQLVAAAGGLAQLAGELPGDTGVDLAVVVRERMVAAVALSELVMTLDQKQLEAVADIARPALERASADGADVAAGLGRIRGEVVHVTTINTFAAEEDTASGRSSTPSIGALSLKDAAQRARLAGKLDDALATLEAANHVNPGDISVLQELVELASELGDHAAAARHLTSLADLMSGSRRGNALLELAELYYDHLDDSARARQSMRAAAEAFGKGARRDATLRMLASEARANLAWAVVVDALESIDPARRAAGDIADLANALVRAGRDGSALALVEDPAVAAKLADGGALAASIRANRDRKLAFAEQLEHEADTANGERDAQDLRDTADSIRSSADPRTKTLPGVVADPADEVASEPRTKTKPGPGEAPTPPAPPSSPNTLGRIKLVSVPRTPPPAFPPIIEIRQSDPEIEIIEERVVDEDPDETGFQSVSDPRVKSGPIPIALASAPARFEDARGSGLIEPPPDTTLRDLPAQESSDDAPIAAPRLFPPAMIVEDDGSPPEARSTLRPFEAARPSDDDASTGEHHATSRAALDEDAPTDERRTTLRPFEAARPPEAHSRTTLRPFDAVEPTDERAPADAVSTDERARADAVSTDERARADGARAALDERPSADASSSAIGERPLAAASDDHVTPRRPVPAVTIEDARRPASDFAVTPRGPFAAIEPTDESAESADGEPPRTLRRLPAVRPPAQIVDDEPDIALGEIDESAPDDASPAITLRGVPRASDEPAADGEPRKPPTLPPLQTLRRPATTTPPRPPQEPLAPDPDDTSKPPVPPVRADAEPTPSRTKTPSYATRTGPIPIIPVSSGSGPIPIVSEDRPSGRRSSTIAPPTPTGDRPRAPSVPPPMEGPGGPPIVTIQPASRRAPTTPPTLGGLPPVPPPAGRERRPSSMPPLSGALTSASSTPASSSGAPAATSSTPDSTSSAPAATSGALATTSSVPAAASSTPGSTSSAPAATSDAPASADAEPGTAPLPVAPPPATTLREYTPAPPRDPAIPTREDATASALLPPMVTDPSLKLSRTTNTALVTLDALAISRASADRLDHAPDAPTATPPSRAVTEQLAVPAVSTASLLTDERERLLAAHREDPDDVPTLTALLANLLEAPALRREVLDAAQRTTHGPALAIVLYELALHARASQDLIRAAALLSRAHETDPTYAPVWMPLADTLAASDELDAARELYEKVAVSEAYDVRRRAFAQDRADALGKDSAVVSGEIVARPRKSTRSASQPNPELERARNLADADDIKGAIAIAEQLATANHEDLAALELLEQLYLRAGDTTGASEAIGRQLQLKDDEIEKAALWRRRAKIYRDTLNRDAEAYRCLKEAHACAPADPEIAYQLRTAAMVRGEWGLVASLLYREIAAAESPRERGALHLELALVFDERLDDDAQAQQNFEQALALDPTIPAAKLPLARRYEMLGRHAEAATLYEEAAASTRPAQRAALYEAAARCKVAAASVHAPSRPTPPGEIPLSTRVEQAEAAGATDVATDLAHQLWRTEPGHPSAYRVLAQNYRTSGDLAALTDITGVRASRAESPEERAAAWISVARLAEELGQLDQAARAYDLALVEDPGHIEALDARGSLAFRLDDFSTADSIYRDLTPSETLLGIDELALRRSIISEKLGRDSEALTLAQTAAEVAPGRRDLVLRVQELATRIGELDTALAAARSVLDLVPLDDEEGKLRAHFALVELMREAGDLDGAVGQLERVLRDYPIHAQALETLAEIHMARGDWQTATRILYQLVPLAPNSQQRAERLYRLGEAVLVHLGDVDRADDVFLRASDLDPSHVPTLRRLLDVYWRADDPGALVEVASELAERGALATGPTAEASLAHALIAAALIGDTQLANKVGTALGDDAPRWIAAALGELAGREGRLQLSSASTAVAELARRGMVDLAKVRAAAAGTPVAALLAAT